MKFERIMGRLPHLVAFIFVVLFVVYPVLTVFVQSFYDDGFTLKYYLEFIKNQYYSSILKNSIMVAGLSTLISLFLGLLFSILIFKTDIKGKNFLKIAVFLPIITPGFVTSLAYVFLFGRHGLITNGILGLEPNIYGWKSVVIMQSIDYTTTAFLIISAVLLCIDSNLEDAARNLGSNEFKVFKNVTFPLLLPGVLSAGLLIFMQSMADFGTPIIVGGNFNTLATASYFEIIGNYNTHMASTLSIILLIPSLILFLLYNKFHKGYGQTFSKTKSYSLKNGHKILLSIPAVFFSVVVYLLFLAVFLAGFTKGFGYNYTFTLDYFMEALQKGFPALKNTILFSLSSSVLGGLLGMSFAYLVVRDRFFGRKFLDLLLIMPFAIPGTFIGIGYLLAFNVPPLLLTGTALIIILNCVVRKLPFSFKTGSSALLQMDKSIEEASLNLGADRLKTFYKVILPMLKPAIIFSMIYTFITTVKTLGSIIFLITANTKVLSAMVFEATINSDLGVAACYSIMMIMLSIAGIFLIWRLKGDSVWS
ncbi:MAG: iron(III) transport system permease protein [Methanothermococcus sp.]|nr:iron(III) transport system permease protein [Methanothermococcus sp.]MDK2988124.1 iron(III) transport system permease protein [Methanothermococcus sp.]